MKTYITDTNVFMRNAYALYILSGNEIPDEKANEEFTEKLEARIADEGKTKAELFSPNDIIVPDTVIRELDSLKDDKNIAMSNSARRGISVMDELLEEYQDEDLMKLEGDQPLEVPPWEKYGDTRKEIELENGAKVIFTEHDEEALQKTNIPDIENDDRILFQATQIIKENPDKKHILVSSDKNLRVKTRLRGIHAEDFEYDTIKDLNQLPPGYFKYNIPLPWKDQVNNNEQISASTQEISKILSNNPVNNQIVAFYKEHTEDLKHFYIAKVQDNIVDLNPVRSKDRLLEFYERSEQLNVKKEKRKCKIVVGETSHQGIKDALMEELFQFKKPNHFPQYENLKDQISRLKKRDFNQNRINEIHNKIQSLDNISEQQRKNAEGIEQYFKGLHWNKEIVPHLLQKPLLEILQDPEIKIITIDGPAGTGKTMWTISDAIRQLIDGKYDAIRYTKPLITADEGVGYLPGDLTDKMAPYKKPAIKNLQTIFGYSGATLDYKKTIDGKIIQLEQQGLIEFEPISFDAGDTWNNRYVIIDESQLFTQDQMRLLIGRVGQGTKIVFIGDLNQISTSAGRKYSYINERNSGLAHVMEKLYGEKIYAHVSLPDDNVLRSDVARLANKI